MKEITIVSIKSLFQYYVFRSIINNNHKSILDNYLIIFNNTQLNDETVNKIKIENLKNFEYLDLRYIIKNNIIIFYEDYTKILNKKINNRRVKSLYLRYKLNLPERILLNLFPKKDIFFFEDGLSDYLSINFYSLQKKYIFVKSKIKVYFYNIKFLFSKNIFLKKFYRNKILEKRFITLLELSDLNEGYNKRLLLKYTNKKINISQNFLEFMIKLNKKLDIKFQENCFMILGHPFLHSHLDEARLKKEIFLYNDIFKKIEKYKTNILFKPHPKTSKDVIKKLHKFFPNKVNILDKTLLAESLLVDKKIKYLGAFLSSSLLYSKIINSQVNVIFFDVSGHNINEFDNKDKSLKDFIKKLNIKILKI